MQDKYIFAESEHEAGFHDGDVKECYKCWQRSLRVKSQQSELVGKLVGSSSRWNELYPEGRTHNALQRSDYYTNRNPLE